MVESVGLAELANLALADLTGRALFQLNAFNNVAFEEAAAASFLRLHSATSDPASEARLALAAQPLVRTATTLASAAASFKRHLTSLAFQQRLFLLLLLLLYLSQLLLFLQLSLEGLPGELLVHGFSSLLGSEQFFSLGASLLSHLPLFPSFGSRLRVYPSGLLALSPSF